MLGQFALWRRHSRVGHGRTASSVSLGLVFLVRVQGRLDHRDQRVILAHRDLQDLLVLLDQRVIQEPLVRLDLKDLRAQAPAHLGPRVIQDLPAPRVTRVTQVPREIQALLGPPDPLVPLVLKDPLDRRAMLVSVTGSSSPASLRVGRCSST